MVGEHKILKDGVRIFRPKEFQALFNAIRKNEHKQMMEALLYTGMRFTEARWLQKNPKAFDGNSILISSTKKKARHKERFIRLNDNGKRAVRYFIDMKKRLPTNQTWDENLLRWAKYAKLDSEGICAKSTRKTWEAWLMCQYGKEHQIEVFLSIGHTKETALEYYLMLPFDDQEKIQMKYYTDGWI